MYEQIDMGGGLFMATADPSKATEQASANDLAIALQALDVEIEYLDSRLADTGPGALAEPLQASFTARRNSLRRACRFFANAAEAVRPSHASARIAGGTLIASLQPGPAGEG